MFVETGNFRPCGRIEAGANWWCYQYDYRWSFTPSVIEGMIHSVGLESIYGHNKELGFLGISGDVMGLLQAI